MTAEDVPSSVPVSLYSLPNEVSTLFPREFEPFLMKIHLAHRPTTYALPHSSSTPFNSRLPPIPQYHSPHPSFPPAACCIA
jgi:hypothetical protein